LCRCGIHCRLCHCYRVNTSWKLKMKRWKRGLKTLSTRLRAHVHVVSTRTCRAGSGTQGFRGLGASRRLIGFRDFRTHVARLCKRLSSEGSIELEDGFTSQHDRREAARGPVFVSYHVAYDHEADTTSNIGLVGGFVLMQRDVPVNMRCTCTTSTLSPHPESGRCLPGF